MVVFHLGEALCNGSLTRLLNVNYMCVCVCVCVYVRLTLL